MRETSQLIAQMMLSDGASQESQDQFATVGGNAAIDDSTPLLCSQHPLDGDADINSSNLHISPSAVVVRGCKERRVVYGRGGAGNIREMVR